MTRRKKAPVVLVVRRAARISPRAGVDMSGLDGLVKSLRALEKERDDALRTLAKIRGSSKLGLGVASEYALPRPWDQRQSGAA